MNLLRESEKGKKSTAMVIEEKRKLKRLYQKELGIPKDQFQERILGRYCVVG